MIKIFRCECRRLLCNKFFIGLLAVLLFYAGQVFYAVALPGVAHTAPFSPWSFGAYLGRLLPLVWVGALFFLTFFTSARERRAAVLRWVPARASAVLGFTLYASSTAPRDQNGCGAPFAVCAVMRSVVAEPLRPAALLRVFFYKQMPAHRF